MRRRDLRKLRRFVDGSDSLMTGHRVIQEDVFFNRICPEWAKHDDQVRGLLLRVFPRLDTNPKQRERAGRWMRVITLYFREGRSRHHVAEVMGIPPSYVKELVRNITRRSEGLSSNHSYVRANRKLGT